MNTVAQPWLDLLSQIPLYNSFDSAEPTDYFDVEAAQFAIDFIEECLVIVEGHAAGQPYLLPPWQKAITAALWGWKRADGRRRFRESLILVPRKNAKTAFASCLLCLELFTTDEAGAQLFSAASSREQASHIFRFASQMILQSPEMSKRARVYKSFKSIEIPATNATFRSLASDSATAHGLGPSFVITDELHSHKDAELIQTLITGTGARKSPLTIHITTTDFARDSACNQKRDYAIKVRDGLIQDSSFLPVIYEAGVDDDWTDPKVWAACNPNLGISLEVSYLERECKRAKAEPSFEPTFRRLHLNQQGISQASKWLSLERWDACKAEFPDLTGRVCYGGLDLSTVLDLSVFSLVFPPVYPDEPYYVLPFCFVPEKKLEDRADRVPYREWARQGHVIATDGEVIDYDFIRKTINELGQKYGIQEIRYDPYNATQIATQLDGDGFVMTQMRQGFLSMNEPCKSFEKAVVSRTIAHNGHPVLRNHIAAVSLKTDASGNIKTDKSSNTERIDAVVATIMALSAADADSSVSNYNTRGILFI